MAISVSHRPILESAVREVEQIRRRHPRRLILFQIGETYYAIGPDAQMVRKVPGVPMPRSVDGAPVVAFDDLLVLRQLVMDHKVAVCHRTERRES